MDFGGLPAARFLGHVDGVEVTLIDRRNPHLFQPLLYRAAPQTSPRGKSNVREPAQFINGFGNRFNTLRRWMSSIVGRARPERVFSVAHTGGDLSTPESVRAIVQPARFPARSPSGDGGQA